MLENHPKCLTRNLQTKICHEKDKEEHMLVEDLPDDISFKSKRGFSLNTLKIEALERLNTSITINPVKDKKISLIPLKALKKTR